MAKRNWRLIAGLGAAAVVIVGHPWALAWLLVGDPDPDERRAWAETAFDPGYAIAAVTADGRAVTLTGPDIRSIDPGPCKRDTRVTFSSTRGSGLSFAGVTHFCRYRVTDALGNEATVAVRMERWAYGAPYDADGRPRTVEPQELSRVLEEIGG